MCVCVCVCVCVCRYSVYVCVKIRARVEPLTCVHVCEGASYMPHPGRGSQGSYSAEPGSHPL